MVSKRVTKRLLPMFKLTPGDKVWKTPQNSRISQGHVTTCTCPQQGDK